MRHVVVIVAAVLLSPVSVHGASSLDRSCKAIDVATGKIVNTCRQTAVYQRRVATTRTIDPFASPHSWGWADQGRARGWGQPAASDEFSSCVVEKPCLNAGGSCGAPGIHRQMAYFKTWLRSMWCR